MIKKLTVDNFKGLDGAAIPFAPLTVIIGDNASGKSTALQALSFLKHCCTSHASKFMDDRGLAAADIVSRLRSRRTMSFRVELELGGRTITWQIEFSVDKAKNAVALRSERVTAEGVVYMQYGGDLRSYFLDETSGEWIPIMLGDYDHSILRVMDVTKNARRYPLLYVLRRPGRPGSPRPRSHEGEQPGEFLLRRYGRGKAGCLHQVTPPGVPRGVGPGCTRVPTGFSLRVPENKAGRAGLPGNEGTA